ncbi:hypothetical protein ABI_47070 [Asticcacaulis biprosthecium C19]|uniref:Uncharacterized protein n=1 Tax=Asticcacaulis biprosthecium C19 TaxID=715226 RepID=F4QU59_9CAUL|nr:hypothetical protein [Asticcacaulis biprosthecium]EGF89359.1 hypothetical protein ABI_47070 [Asticcacaulis biprosthecium C19]
MKKQVFVWVAGVVLSLGMSSYASAMDLASVQRHEEPELTSNQAVQVCAASMMGAAYMAEKGSEDAELYTTLGRAWVSLSQKVSTRSGDDYINNELMPDMEALYNAGDETVKFYKLYCLKASKQLLEG